MSRNKLQLFSSSGELLKHYNPTVATSIHQYIVDFIPLMDNFGSVDCDFIQQGGQKLLLISCQLFVPPPSSNMGPGVSHQAQKAAPITVNLLFPQQFPSVPLFCILDASRYNYNNIRQWSVRQPSQVVAPNGAVRLSELALLKGAAPPYSLVEILVAVREQFELEFPLVSKDFTASADPCIARPHPPLTPSAEKDACVERATDALMFHLLSKAEGYLDTREKSLRYLGPLYKCGGAMREARGQLQSRKAELLHVSPAVGEVEKMLSNLQSLSDTVETHAVCLVPTDDLQARALELLGEIHAIDDVLDLLERSLRAGQLSCDEYVRRVSDVGRKQFEARFLFARVTAAVNRAADGAPNSPNVRPPKGLPIPPRNEPRARPVVATLEIPDKLDNVDVLHKEFPEVGTEMIKAVLNLADGNLRDARVQLKAMLS